MTFRDDSLPHWNKRRRRATRPIDDPLLDFIELFNEMVEHQMDEPLRPREDEADDLPVSEHIRIFGAESDPPFHAFGNTKRESHDDAGAGHSRSGGMEREPLIDVLSDHANVRVIIELPGVKKDDVSISISGKTLTVHAPTAAPKFHKEIPLTFDYDADKANAAFNNGVLEITLPKKDPGKRENTGGAQKPAGEQKAALPRAPPDELQGG